MKSLEELKALRESMQSKMNLRKEDADSIAAGARPVLNALVEEVNKRGLKNVQVTQTGCIGVCRLEPIVEVYVPGQEKVTYVKMTPEKVPQIVAQHLVNKQVVTEYTIGAAE